MFLATVTIPILICFQATDPRLKDWKELNPKGDGFRVMMPGKPDKKTATVETPQGDVKITLYAIESKKTVFMVLRSDLPPEVDVKDVKKLLDEARDQGVKNSRGKLKSEKEIELDGNPGREMVLDLPDSRVKGGGIYKSRIYLVGHTHFQVAAMVPKSEEDPEEIKAFLDSFRLKDDDAKPEDKKKEKRPE